jgi:RNA polymerase sigma-70 factor, ECF subfamily
MDRFIAERPSAVGDAASERESAAELRYLLSLLSEAQRAVLILVELEGFTSLEVAEALGVPPGTVHSRLRAAKQQLARVLELEKQRAEVEP